MIYPYTQAVCIMLQHNKVVFVPDRPKQAMIVVLQSRSYQLTQLSPCSKDLSTRADKMPSLPSEVLERVIWHLTEENVWYKRKPVAQQGLATMMRVSMVGAAVVVIESS